MTMNRNFSDTLIEELLSLIHQSPTAFQAAEQLKQRCLQAGFKSYKSQNPLEPGDCRFITEGDSALFAFTIGDEPLSTGFRMVGTHIDAPALKIKPNSLIQREGALILNTEIYGSPILSSWFDRPLSLAGRVLLDNGNPLSPLARLIDLKRPLLVIPSAAIHLNPTVNSKNEIKPQQMMLPIIAMADPETKTDRVDDQIAKLVTEHLSIDSGQLIDYELFLYDCTPGTRLGLNQEFIQSARLDNLGLADAAITALTHSQTKKGINLVACFDHEEVGSRTRQGAIGMTLRDYLERIVLSLGGTRQDFLNLLPESFLISADQAHAVHPNFADRSDPTNRPVINRGPVIKYAASRAYTTDADSSSVFQMLCRQTGVPYQHYVNHSDIRGGSTIGPLLIEHLPIRSVDVGNPIWGMHAIRETGGVADQIAMTQVFQTFFELN